MLSFHDSYMRIAEMSDPENLLLNVVCTRLSSVEHFRSNIFWCKFKLAPKKGMAIHPDTPNPSNFEVKINSPW